MNNLAKTIIRFITIQREMHVPNFADTAAPVRLRKRETEGDIKM